jgi:hypothetical protein
MTQEHSLRPAGDLRLHSRSGMCRVHSQPGLQRTALLPTNIVADTLWHTVLQLKARQDPEMQ